MTGHEFLSEDGLVVLALCSGLGYDSKTGAGLASPLTLSEWNKLASVISNSSLKNPAGILGQESADLGKALQIPIDEAERLATLLERASRLPLELESLFSRGMWVVTRVDSKYPAKLRDSLQRHAPAVLFGAGRIELLARSGIAVVGSRGIDAVGAVFAQEVGRKSAAAGLPIVSGGAKGTDRLAMQGALEGGGIAFGVLADTLERTIRQGDVRQFLLDEKLVLLTPYLPTAGFSVGAAMGRNKLIYGLADFAVVVSSDFQTGGTWAGAVEALKAGWCPVFVRDGQGVPQGNRELLKRGAAAVSEAELEQSASISEWLRGHAQSKQIETDLFGHA